MARPLLSSTELRGRCDLYLTSAERAIIQSKASGAGLALSAFIRRAALNKPVAAVPSIAAEQWAKLAGLAANINQIAHRLNAGNRLNGNEAIVLDEMRLHLTAIRLELTGKLE